MINDYSQLHISGWMINELKLKGSALLVYALIFSFTNGTDDHAFHGSANYIAEWCGISRRAVVDILKKLVDRKLVERRDVLVNGVKYVDYFTPCEVSSHHTLLEQDNNISNTSNIGCEVSSHPVKLEAPTRIIFSTDDLRDFAPFIDAFRNYWEETDSKGVPLWRKQKTWDTHRRLITWKKNDETNFGRNKPQLPMDELKQAAVQYYMCRNSAERQKPYKEYLEKYGVLDKWKELASEILGAGFIK